MTDYSKGKIYKIESQEAKLVYYGFTTTELRKRLYKLRSSMKQHTQGKGKYDTSFEVLKYEDHTISLIENYGCEKRSDLQRRVADYIRDDVTCVNNTDTSYIPKVSSSYHKSYYRANWDKLTRKQIQYREDNRDKLSEQRQRNYRCDCGAVIQVPNKSRHERTKKHRRYLGEIE